MKLKFSGVEISFQKGLGNIVEIIADLQTDEITTEHDKDAISEFTHVCVGGNSICVEKDTLKCELIEE